LKQIVRKDLLKVNLKQHHKMMFLPTPMQIGGKGGKK
jgi:hypothetical protein